MSHDREPINHSVEILKLKLTKSVFVIPVQISGTDIRNIEASIHEADGRLTVRSREVSKLRDWVL